MNNQQLKIVLDTNVFLVSLASNHKYSWVYDALLDGKFDLCVSNEILLEYTEIIASRYGLEQTLPILEGLTLLPNIHLINPHYNWLLLKDEDDNKFVDCAIAASADIIVSNDKDFQLLKEISFPPINLLSYNEFESTYKTAFTSLS